MTTHEQISDFYYVGLEDGGDGLRKGAATRAIQEVFHLTRQLEQQSVMQTLLQKSVSVEDNEVGETKS